MELNIRARHLNLTSALSSYVHKKVEKAQRYFDSIIWAQVILAVEKHRHTAEIVVHTPGNTFRTLGESEDLYAAIDIAAHKLDLHMVKAKEKQKGHRPKNQLEVNQEVLPVKKANRSKSEKSLLEKEMETVPQLVSEVDRVALESKTLAKAIKEIEANGAAFNFFINNQNNRISLLYRKAGKEFGLIELD